VSYNENPDDQEDLTGGYTYYSRIEFILHNIVT